MLIAKVHGMAVLIALECSVHMLITLERVQVPPEHLDLSAFISLSISGNQVFKNFPGGHPLDLGSESLLNYILPIIAKG